MNLPLRTATPLPAAALPAVASAAAPAAVWAACVRTGLDGLRLQHAAAVRAGVLPRSMLGSARFEAWLGSVERLSLGRLARSV